MIRFSKQKYLPVITILKSITFVLATSVIGVIIHKFRTECNYKVQITALLPFAPYFQYRLFSAPYGTMMDRVKVRFVLLIGIGCCCVQWNPGHALSHGN